MLEVLHFLTYVVQLVGVAGLALGFWLLITH